MNDILSSIREYRDRLEEEPSLKDASIFVPAGLASPETFVENAKSLIQGIESPFALFSIAKHGFALCRAANDYSVLAGFFPQWLYICVNVGAYDECLAFSESCMAASNWQTLNNSGISVYLLRNRAKALRNLGRFDEALACYRASIERARALRMQADIGIGLLLIGKLYGNYLGQQSLFSAFVEDARTNLINQLRLSQAEERTRLTRYLAICHDALGQVYREADSEQALRHFTEAIKINRGIGRGVGVSRAICHLNFFRFMREGSPKYLRWFQYGLRLLQEDRLEERGLGVRWIQYAGMLHKTGNRPGAEECLAEGQKIASRYSDYKSIARACLVEAKLYAEKDPQRALSALTSGREVARRYNLLLYESAINRDLARLPIRTPPEGLEPIALLERNREIHLRHLDSVKANLQRLHSEDSEHEEFKLLSQQTKDDFRQRLLLDFERIVSELDLNIRTLTGALRRSEDRRHDLLVLGVANLLARDLAHDAKIKIPIDEKINLFDAIAKELDNIGIDLFHLSGDPTLPVGALGLLRSRLLMQASKVRGLEKRMEKVKIYLSKQLRRPQVMTEEVSLKSACQRAAAELEEDIGGTCLLAIAFICDVILTSNRDMIVRVVKNLIRNAVQDLARRGLERKVIRISLTAKSIGDLSVGNFTQSPVLSIMSDVDSPQVACEIGESLRRGLAGDPSESPFASGVGLDHAQMVFDLLRASLQVVTSGSEAGVQVIFHLGSGLAKLA